MTPARQCQPERAVLVKGRRTRFLNDQPALGQNTMELATERMGETQSLRDRGAILVGRQMMRCPKGGAMSTQQCRMVDPR